MKKIRLHFIDGSQQHFYNPVISTDGMLLKAFDSESDLITYIPLARIHKWIELGEINKK